MARKLALIFAVLAISYVANAATATPTSDSATTANFNVAPASIFLATETNFGSQYFAQYGSGSDATMNWVWLNNYASSSTNILVERRGFSGTAPAASTTNDAKLTPGANVNSDNAPLTAAAGGYFCMVTLSGATNKDLTVSYGSSSDTTVLHTNAAINGNAAATTSYLPLAIWIDSGVCYLIYTTYNTGTSTATNLQWYSYTMSGTPAVKTAAKTDFYTYSGAYNKVTVSVTGTVGTGSSTAYIVLRDTNGANPILYSFTMSMTTPAVPGTAPSAWLTDGSTTYLPAGVFGSSNGYGVWIRTLTGTTYGTNLYLNGVTGTNVVTSTAYVQPSSTGYYNSMNWAYTTSDGFVQITEQTSTTAGNPKQLMAALYKTADGTQKVAPQSIGTYASYYNIFADNGNIPWIGYTSYDTANANVLVQGYAGKIAEVAATTTTTTSSTTAATTSSTSGNSADALKSLFAGLALMVAALFAF